MILMPLDCQTVVPVRPKKQQQKRQTAAEEARANIA